MILVRPLLLALLILAAPTALHAQCTPRFNWSGFYPPAILDRVAQRTGPGLRSNFEQVMLPRLTDQERRALRGVTLYLGQREDQGHPLNFFAAPTREVVLPLSSVRLVSDLTLALAWMNRRRLPEQRVFDYAAMLAFRGPAPDGVRALPLAALGVPADADSDPAVEALFQKMFGAIMVFIMGHEIGHLFHDHRAGVDDARSRAQEGEADAFAVELMARLGAPPIGIGFYFMMAAPFERPECPTHPLSGARIERLVAALRDNATLFARDKPSPARERQLIEDIATDLGTVATLLDDPDIRASMRQVGMASKVSDFAARQPPGSAPTPGTARQAFDGAYAGQWTDAKGVALDFRMDLRRQGQTVRGTYEFGLGNAELEGTITGDQLDYAWRWGTEYFGRGRLKAGADGALTGTWGYTQRFEGAGVISAKPR